MVPKLTALKRDLVSYLDYYDYDRATSADTPRGGRRLS